MILLLFIIRTEHTNFNLQTANEAIDVSMDIMDSMFDGKLSTRIGEIYEIEEHFDNFLDEASEMGYTPAVKSHVQLYQMITS